MKTQNQQKNAISCVKGEIPTPADNFYNKKKEFLEFLQSIRKHKDNKEVSKEDILFMLLEKEQELREEARR